MRGIGMKQTHTLKLCVGTDDWCPWEGSIEICDEAGTSLAWTTTDGTERDFAKTVITACNSYYDNQATIASQAAEIARLREALKKIADPKQLASHGDPTVLRDVARAALEAST